MIRYIKPISLLIYFALALFFMEAVLRASTTGGIFSQGLFYAFVFSTVVAILFYGICSLFSQRTSLIIASLLLALSAVIFGTQMIYFKFFQGFYSLHLVGIAPQLLGFWKDILVLMGMNLLWILLLFMPMIVLLLWGRQLVSYVRVSWSYRAMLIGLLVITHLLAVGTVLAGGKGRTSAYELYYNISNPDLSVERLGLITTMRLDLQRLVTGWTPHFELPPVIVNPDPPGGGDDIPILEYNVMDIDFNKLIEQEEDQEIREMHLYFQSLEPTSKNEFTGMFEGYNLVFITAEAFSHHAVSEELTPTLYKMLYEGFHFTDYYAWGGHTSDGEYVACTSLIPAEIRGHVSFKRSSGNYLPFVMGNQLKALGYKTLAYHNHFDLSAYGRKWSHPNMGYVYKSIYNGLEMKYYWPSSDHEMLQVTVPEYINDEPFHAYYMTVSGHMQYNFTGNTMARRHQSAVSGLPYSTTVQAYLATQLELENALTHLMDELEKAGIAERTLIVLSTDHWPYGLTHSVYEELAGYKLESNFELHKNGLIIYAKGMEPMTITQPASNLDIIPTISNLLGLEFDSRLLMGRDALSDSAPLAILKNRSWISDLGRYNFPRDRFYPALGVTVDEEYVQRINQIVNAKFYYSERMLYTDYYRKVFPAD